MIKVETMQLSSLEKVFLNGSGNFKQYNRASALKGEEFSYQIAFTNSVTSGWAGKSEAEIKVESEIADLVSVRLVKNVPSELSVNMFDCDEGYITKSSGLFPDALMPVESNIVEVIPNLWKSLWVSVKIPEDFSKSGEFDIKITVGDTKNVFTLDIIDVSLPKQELKFTQWFHSDCIADVHGAEIYSDTHWSLIEKYIKTARDNGINMLLTPVFTLPLDTQVGGERPTFQLVDVYYDGEYKFGFEKLEKWIDICLKNGIEYFEISHLFTQWGAKHAPKIAVFENGEEIKKFGWQTDATDKEYAEFLDSFLPKLVLFLKEKGIAKKTYFHVSDEPGEEHAKNYEKAKNIIKKHLGGFKIIDALSNVEFYKNGLVEIPVPGSNHIEAFLKENIAERWTYYCCAQGKDVSNRFFAMPSERNRVIGAQLFKFDIDGFLHWGYNFYYSQFSKRLINPYEITDGDGAFPSGDAFSVYPYKDGVCESIRLKVFKEALQDMRAMELLAEHKGKEFVVKIIDEKAKCDVKFGKFPFFGDYVLKYRKKINDEIKKLVM